MSAVPSPDRGVLLALSGDDAEILRALSVPGSGMSVVRRCADLPELLSAGMAGLASLVVLDTDFDETDRTVLERLGSAGLAGLLLVPDGQEARWATLGWSVLSREAEPAEVRRTLQGMMRDSGQGRGRDGGQSRMSRLERRRRSRRALRLADDTDAAGATPGSDIDDAPGPGATVHTISPVNQGRRASGALRSLPAPSSPEPPASPERWLDRKSVV